jgi:hypothetical protein
MHGGNCNRDDQSQPRIPVTPGCRDCASREQRFQEVLAEYLQALEAGGGEYPSQDGFGWTNGVLLALINKYGLPK